MKSYQFAGQEYRSLKRLAKAAGIDYWTLKRRLGRGWNLDRALGTPVNAYQATTQRAKPKHEYKGKMYSLKQLPSTLSYAALYYRIVLKGWSVKDAVEIPLRSQLKNEVKTKPAPVVPKNWLHRRSMAGCSHTNFEFDTTSRRCRICGAGGGA